MILVWIRRQYTCAPIRWSWAPVHRTQIVVIEVVLLRPTLPITTQSNRSNRSNRSNPMNHDHLLHGMSTILGKFVCYSTNKKTRCSHRVWCRCCCVQPDRIISISSPSILFPLHSIHCISFFVRNPIFRRQKSNQLQPKKKSFKNRNARNHGSLHSMIVCVDFHTYFFSIICF